MIIYIQRSLLLRCTQRGSQLGHIMRQLFRRACCCSDIIALFSAMSFACEKKERGLEFKRSKHYSSTFKFILICTVVLLLLSTVMSNCQINCSAHPDNNDTLTFLLRLFSFMVLLPSAESSFVSISVFLPQVCVVSDHCP